MRYNGTRLKELLRGNKGAYTNLAERMSKYRRQRKNASENTASYCLTPFLKDGHNITLSNLSALMLETGKTIDFFVDFDPGELPLSFTVPAAGVSGSHNIINSSITNDLTMKLEHQTELIRIKDQMLVDKERIITLKDSEIQQWQKRYDDLIQLTKSNNSDKFRT